MCGLKFNILHTVLLFLQKARAFATATIACGICGNVSSNTDLLLYAAGLVIGSKASVIAGIQTVRANVTQFILSNLECNGNLTKSSVA